ncbi:hypothetical protein [Pedobacter gandavensis]|uniref:Outer membrane protein beta-barrel domain-containing protein n=1 Tax=Pedobacter gandavensis TaxID=2679963 RepID=A0ABR6EYK4_9SPHI|nr:hypothetical protein [Pedobacter gandavensis]MBB2149924.1 hypothetical protein [Pedobacter gandavensis]
MKKQLLILVLLLSGGTAVAQMNSDYNYSITVRGYGLVQLPKVFNETDPVKYTSTSFSGLTVKFNDNQINYRLGGSYIKQSKTFYNNCNNCEVVKGDITDYNFKVGFEKNMNFSMVQPYIGADIGYRSSRFVGVSQNVNTLKADVSGAVIPPVKMETSKNGFIISPVVGIKVHPLPQWSIFVESSLDFFYSYERQEGVVEDAGNYRSFTRTNKSEFLLNPVSVGVSFHLGGNK